MLGSHHQPCVYCGTQIHARSPRFNQSDHQFRLLQNDPHIPRDIQEVICLQSSKSKPVAVRSLSKWANLSSAALRSNLTLVMRLVNQLNSLKTATEFATSQGYGRCGAAALPASCSEGANTLPHVYPLLSRFLEI